MLSMIAAISENYVIGKDNELVWNMPEDTAFFKRTTLNHTIIMGRKTFDSIGKPLPKRKNMIISRDKNLLIDKAEVYPSLEEALLECDPDQENFIVGGETLYRKALPLAERIYLTIIHTHLEGDRYFPELSPLDWKIMNRDERKADDANPYDFTFLTYDRIA